MCLSSLGNCSCIALIPSIPGHMLPATPEGGCARRHIMRRLRLLSYFPHYNLHDSPPSITYTAPVTKFDAGEAR